MENNHKRQQLELKQKVAEPKQEASQGRAKSKVDPATLVTSRYVTETDIKYVIKVSPLYYIHNLQIFIYTTILNKSHS